LKRVISGTILTLLFTFSIFLAFNVRPASAAAVTVYINFDGSVTPSSAPISSPDNVTYTLTGNINYPTYAGIAVGKSNIVIDGNGHTVQGSLNDTGNGIDMTDLNNVTVKNVNVQHFQYGIYLASSNNNTLFGNVLTANSQDGIYLVGSLNNVVVGNGASANTYVGILLDASYNNTVSYNMLTANNASGIYLFNSYPNNIIIGNNASGNTAVSADGIVLYSSPNNLITGNTASVNSNGIVLYSSTNNVVSGNNASANSQIGIWLETSSSSNTVSGNTASSNGLYGIFLSASSNGNTIKGNTISANNPYGLALLSSANSTIYHNDFIANSHQVYIADSASNGTAWDNGYPSGGNYWRDYNGTDTHSGPYQNVAGSDGIGDTPYSVDANNTDHYPLMGPFGSTTRTGLNVTVFPSENMSLTFQNVTVAGSTIVNVRPTFSPPLSGLVGEYYEVIVNATFTGNVTVRMIFDGSNMTQQQKGNLTMMEYTPLIADMSGSTPGVSDGVVNMRDIAYIIAHFATTPNSTNWDPRCDIYGPTAVPDGVVNMRDIAFAVACFNQASHWVDITSHVDTANNVMYGQTTHFSFIGIH
jgi:parallel beta-helix repeat protein